MSGSAVEAEKEAWTFLRGYLTACGAMNAQNTDAINALEILHRYAESRAIMFDREIEEKKAQKERIL